jgi:galactokinase
LIRDLEQQRIRMAARIGRDDARMVVSPYRVCPIGAHIDHQGGPVLGMAISAHTLLAFAPTLDGSCRLVSENYPGEMVFDLAQLGDADPKQGAHDWGSYARGAAALLRDCLPAAARGIEGCVLGTLPGGGLGSSASVTLAYLTALAAANEIELEPEHLVELAQRAEHDWVGVACGMLDQVSIVGARRSHLLFIDTQRTCWEAVAIGEDAPDYRILVAYTGIERSLAATGFNQRVEECHAAARTLATRLGVGNVTRLGDLPEADLAASLDTLPEVEGKRARHFHEERDRVRRGIAAWREGDLESFGALMNDSCRSSRENFETGSPELIRLHEILASGRGVFGSRFSGAGFGGCAIALVARNAAEEAAEAAERSFRKAFPALAEDTHCFLVDSDDGVRVL